VGGGPGEEALRAKIQETHMENHVRMVGMRENPYPYIRRADLYVQPSRVESFGLTICEALLLGRQVIATDTDGARELLEQAGLGNPFDGETLRRVCAAADKYLEDYDLTGIE
jgi:glycosyltransferase involved in cell wall biosynthesis